MLKDWNILNGLKESDKQNATIINGCRINKYLIFRYYDYVASIPFISNQKSQYNVFVVFIKEIQCLFAKKKIFVHENGKYTTMMTLSIIHCLLKNVYCELKSECDFLANILRVLRKFDYWSIFNATCMKIDTFYDFHIDTNICCLMY